VQLAGDGSDVGENRAAVAVEAIWSYPRRRRHGVRSRLRLRGARRGRRRVIRRGSRIRASSSSPATHRRPQDARDGTAATRSVLSCSNHVEVNPNNPACPIPSHPIPSRPVPCRGWSPLLLPGRSGNLPSRLGLSTFSSLTAWCPRDVSSVGWCGAVQRHPNFFAAKASR
jgi:hypothetical protein